MEALSNDAKRTILSGLKQTVVEGGNLSSCFDGMEQTICLPETDDCFNATLNSIQNTAFNGDSVSWIS